jgi:hypothetical protein
VESYDPMSMRWSTKEDKEEEDENEGEKKKLGELDECCFVFKKKVTPQGGELPPIIDKFLDIKSWYLRKVGKEVVGTMAGITWSAKSLEVHLSLNIDASTYSH